MASYQWERSNNVQYDELSLSTAHTILDTEEVTYSSRSNRTPLVSDHEKLLPVRTTYSSASPNSKPSLLPLGKPTVKKRLHLLDISAVASSFICLALSVIAVANDSVSWRLGVKNYQLIVIGVLISLMNMCLGSVAPTFFLLLEARFGSSTLQNYDGILRNQFLSPKLSLLWRLVLGLGMALPLGLSVAYKSFIGGESAMQVNATAYIGNASYYGMFAPPGLQSLGEKTGISLFFNATLPFAVATSSINGSEPRLPAHAQAYGYNVLLLNNESTAMLDIPQPSYVSTVQSLLASGESWTITAPVIATVATFNNSKVKDQRAYESHLKSLCASAVASSGAYEHMSMMNDWSVDLLGRVSPGNANLQYIALAPDPGIDHVPPCSTSNFSYYAKPYDINRQFCKGTWSITRGGIQLVDGSCNGTILLPEKQLIITNTSLFLPVWYMSTLVEFLGPFATSRNESEWAGPSIATAMAAMLWSRITILSNPAILAESNAVPQSAGPGANFTLSSSSLPYEDKGLIYLVDDVVIYIRPTVRKSGWLYCVFAIQPLVIVIMLVLNLMFHSVPLDKGFGLISILSGIDHGSLDTLTGAALSGELRKRVKLTMVPIQDNQKGLIEYHVALPSTAPMHNGRLVRKVVYH